MSAGPLLALALLSAPPDMDRFFQEWAERMKGLTTLEVRFRQEKRLKVLRRPLLSRGVIRLKVAEHRLKCVLFDPEGKVETELLVEKEAVRMFYPALRRLEIYELGAGAAPPISFPGLGGDLEPLKRDYQLTLERSGGEDRLTLIPRDPASPVREQRLVLKDYLVKELVQVDKSGDSIRLAIEEFKKNPVLKEEDLKLEVPPGTEVARPLGGRPAPKQSP
jgi:hypothetical protein